MYSQDVIDLNPHLFTPKSKPTTKRESDNEAKFVQLWKYLDGPALEREYKFDPDRRSRFDFCYPPQKLAIEIEGYGHQKHNRYNGDVDKYNRAALQGWRLYRLTKALITIPELRKLIDHIREVEG
jgi:very-short-patch-repair endonuclease